MRRIVEYNQIPLIPTLRKSLNRDDLSLTALRHLRFTSMPDRAVQDARVINGLLYIFGFCESAQRR